MLDLPAIRVILKGGGEVVLSGTTAAEFRTSHANVDRWLMRADQWQREAYVDPTQVVAFYDLTMKEK